MTTLAQVHNSILDIIGHHVHREMGAYGDGAWWDHWYCLCGWEAWADARIDDAQMTLWHNRDTEPPTPPEASPLDKLARYVDELHRDNSTTEDRRCCADQDGLHNALVNVAAYINMLNHKPMTPVDRAIF
jgi:hypothetical protein